MGLKIPCLALVALLVLLGSRCPAGALSVAVFPVDDLSSADNSESQAMTDFLRREMAQRGLSVVEKQAVSDFMSARRIRQLGTLPSQEIIAVRTELLADFVLLGALCQKNETAAAIGMTLSLLRTSDAKTVWASSKGVSLEDEQRFLGIKAPASMADLLPILAQSLFTSWPVELDSPAVAGGLGHAASASAPSASLEVDSVFFSPKYVRPGQEVNCTIRFRVKNAPLQCKVFVKVGDRIHTAATDDGVYYQVSWRGSEDKKGGPPVLVTMNSTDSRILSGVLSGAAQDDVAFPVSLIVEGPAGLRAESYLGFYVVDSLAPEVSIKTQGKKINEVVSFRTELPVSVHFKRSEPIAQWEFTVTAPDGQLLLSEKGSDQPPANFVWRGQDSKNLRAAPGLYTLSLTVLDRAQNQGVATERVRLLAAAPGLNLSLAGQDEQLQATLTALDGVPVTSWRMELWGADSTMLKTYAGDSLPVRIALPKVAGAGKIECVLQVKDSLGMRATRKIPDLLAQVTAGNTSAPGARNAAGPSQGASDAWQTDF